MNLTYTLIPGGYRIFNDGSPWIRQEFQPGLPGFIPYPDEASASAAAEAAIAELTAAAAEAPSP